MSVIDTKEVKTYLESGRDNAIRSLWITFINLSDVAELSQEDLDIWDSVTKHSAVQDRLSGE